MNDVINFITQHLIEVISLGFSVVTALFSYLLFRINKKIHKDLQGIDIDGDGVGDIEDRFASYYLMCKHCHRYTKLSEATFIKEVKDDEEKA